MHIIVIGWLYVTVLMAATETSLLAGVITFIFWGLLPAGLMFWLLGSKNRRHLRRAKEAAEEQLANPPKPGTSGQNQA